MKRIGFDEVTRALEILRGRAERWLPPDVGMMIECASETERDARLRDRLAQMYERFISAGISGGSLGLETSCLFVYAAVGSAAEPRGFTLEDAVRRVSAPPDFELVTESVPGDVLHLTVMPIAPDYREGVFPCASPLVLPEEAIALCERYDGPFVAGVGFGASEDDARRASLLSLRRPVDTTSSDARLARLEGSAKQSMTSRAAPRGRALAVLAEGGAPGFCAVRLTGAMLRRANCQLKAEAEA